VWDLLGARSPGKYKTWCAESDINKVRLSLENSVGYLAAINWSRENLVSGRRCGAAAEFPCMRSRGKQGRPRMEVRRGGGIYGSGRRGRGGGDVFWFFPSTTVHLVFLPYERFFWCMKLVFLRTMIFQPSHPQAVLLIEMF
jgi:hypothetical protein